MSGARLALSLVSTHGAANAVEDIEASAKVAQAVRSIMSERSIDQTGIPRLLESADWVYIRLRELGTAGYIAKHDSVLAM
jgi:hypothetical protein